VVAVADSGLERRWRDSGLVACKEVFEGLSFGWKFTETASMDCVT
jgi:hypothetical protein